MTSPTSPRVALTLPILSYKWRCETGSNLGLNDIALKWMRCKAHAAGLPIGDHDIEALSPDPSVAPQHDPLLPDIRNIGPADRGDAHGARQRVWACWADLMRRAFEVDVLACPRCGGARSQAPRPQPLARDTVWTER